MKKPWQRLQDNFKASAEREGMFIYRLKDAPKDFEHDESKKSKRRFTPTNTCDFLLFDDLLKALFAVEAKSFTGKSFGFSNMNETHEKEMLEWAELYEHVHPCILLEFRDLDETYMIHIVDYHDYKINTDRKSIPIAEVRNRGILVRSKILKVNHRYFIYEALEKIVGRKW